MKENGILKNLFGQSRRAKAELPDGLQLSVIGYLIERQKRGEALRTDIEHEYSLKPSTAEALLDDLEQGGLIARSAGDGIERVALTARGYELYNSAMNQIWNLDFDPQTGLGEEVFSALAQELGDAADCLS